MGDVLSILRDGARTTLVVRVQAGGIEHRFEPPEAHAEFLYVGSEVGVADIEGMPVVIISFQPGHEIKGQPDWQYLVDVAHGELRRHAPWR